MQIVGIETRYSIDQNRNLNGYLIEKINNDHSPDVAGSVDFVIEGPIVHTKETVDGYKRQELPRCSADRELYGSRKSTSDVIPHGWVQDSVR